MTFQWPIGRVWPGYLNPRRDPCPTCNGDGLAEGRRHLTHSVQQLLRHPALRDLAEGLAGRPPLPGFGHDVLDVFSATRAITEAAGLDSECWGICPTCGGEGFDPALADEREAWQPSDPPIGEGRQLWETTSEGSPLSPVFASLEELCTWAADNATLVGDERLSADDWLRLLGPGSQPSGTD